MVFVSVLFASALVLSSSLGSVEIAHGQPITSPAPEVMTPGMPLPHLSSSQPQSTQGSSDNAFQDSTIQTNTISSATANSFTVTHDFFVDYGVVDAQTGAHATAQVNIRYTGQIIFDGAAGHHTVSSVSGTCDFKFFLNGVLTEHKTGSPTYGAFQLENNNRLQLGIVSDNTDFCYWSSTHLVPINIPYTIENNLIRATGSYNPPCEVAGGEISGGYCNESYTWDITVPTNSLPTKEDYEKIALEKICLSPDTDFNTLSRDDWRNINERITGRYAQLYLTNPGAFKWAGMAAYASDLVGTGMGTLGRSSLHDEFFYALKDGNMNLYMSIGWQFEVYLAEGLAGLERLYSQTEGQLGEIQLTAWGMIDQGIKTGNSELVWQGNAALLFYEQNVFLQQTVYDPHRQLWQWVSEHPLIPTFSPIPNDSTTFVKYMKKTHSDVSPDLGDATQRWDWISNSMLPKYKQLETQNPAKVGLDMTKYAADLLNICIQ